MEDQTTPDSPLNEATQQALEDLFFADPLSLTDEDYDTAVRAYREQRERLEAAGSNRKGRAKAPKVEKAADKETIDLLKDLGL